jgi:hypothetical protein
MAHGCCFGKLAALFHGRHADKMALPDYNSMDQYD